MTVINAGSPPIPVHPYFSSSESFQLFKVAELNFVRDSTGRKSGVELKRTRGCSSCFALTRRRVPLREHWVWLAPPLKRHQGETAMLHASQFSNCTFSFIYNPNPPGSTDTIDHNRHRF